ncbi:MAG: 16S rRNA (cytidine(1402)-2'-O)-methyltransferase [Firmicutes bacterium]|nr:16S rRNA (cytidine(1402)-2'-O)-methyltransferase [Bacillota bacterium]
MTKTYTEEILPGSLYIVATPIGNLGEITERAKYILSTVNYIVAEDTRNTGLLLKLLDVSHQKFIAYHKFNETAKQDYILQKLQQGNAVALVSDAGMPCISDPGYILVKSAAKMGIAVHAVSGACAMVNALAVSGFPTEPFVFVGFLPKKQPIQEIFNPFLQSFQSSFYLQSTEKIPAGEKTTKKVGLTAVFYQSPKRIIGTLQDLSEHFPWTKICLCNDISKKFERIYRGNPKEVLEELQANKNAEKGEYTCVIFFANFENGNSSTNGENLEKSPQSLESQLVDIMLAENCSVKIAVSILSKKLSKVSKKDIYAAGINLKEIFEQ